MRKALRDAIELVSPLLVYERQPLKGALRGEFAPELQVIKFVGEVQGIRCRFRAYTTKSPKHFLFRPLPSEGFDIPVLKSELAPEVLRCLNAGMSFIREAV